MRARERMRYLGYLGVGMVGGLVASFGVLAGCDDSCRATLTCEPLPMLPLIDAGAGDGGGEGGSGGEGGGGGGPDCPEDPADAGTDAGGDGGVDERCGVWVSPSLGDDSKDGTQAMPVKTLAKAISLAQTGIPRIYACGEEYKEAVTLPGGVSLFGGFDCSNDWRYVGEPARAEILAPPALAALTLLASEATSFVADVNVTAGDAVDPGTSSIAVFARPNSRARLRRVTLTAGNGADGADGEPGHHDGQPALKGLTGDDGMHACAMDPGLGGLGTMIECGEGTASISGQGGDGNQAFANAGLDGFPFPDPNLQGYGTGGKGEDSAGGVACTPGLGGAQGEDGDHGLGGSAPGRLTLDGYLGTSGQDGEAGTPGQGGGGGGASLGSLVCGAAPHGGAGGGAGGTGGCGGRGGDGGQAGGASIAVALLSDDIHVEHVRLVSGKGGNGGNGGPLQPGGQGGLPGYGGWGAGGLNGAQGGCAGGAGGQGGDGGNGGGGHGGHSASVASTPGNVLKTGEWVGYVPGEGGKAGTGGDSTQRTGTGADGLALAVLALDP